jgi:hypothetical protein
MKREFEMSEADLEKLYDAAKPVPYLIFNGIGPRSPQERANDAWEELGRRLGFEHTTVEPIPGKGDRFFRAEPVEVAALTE